MKEFLDGDGLRFYSNLIKTDLDKKIGKSDVVNNLTSELSEAPLSALQGKILNEKISDLGKGNMSTTVYDTNNDGVVDNAEKLGGLSPDAYAKAGDAKKYVDSVTGQDGGLAPLGNDKKIPSEYLPSYVDDVVEGYLHEGTFYNDEHFVSSISPERGKIYVDLIGGGSWRWSGSMYVPIETSDMVEMSNETIQGIWDET